MIEVTPQEYASLFNATSYVFNTVAFNELNKSKVDAARYFIFRDTKIKLGICFGQKDGWLKSPFSAPFGGFAFVSEERKFFAVEESVALIERYAREKGLKVSLTLPPEFYAGSVINESTSVLLRSNFNLAYSDVNYQFFCKDFENYERKLDHSTRKNLQRALKAEFEFHKLDSSDKSDVERAYAVIQANRTHRGFPLRMTLGQVWETVQVVKADFFVLSVERHDAAAAQVFHVAPGIVQVIYWGDAPGFSDKKVMNLLSYKVFEHYAQAGDIQIVDIGPSTENGIPNFGLCEFKENIGCKTALKYTFEYDGTAENWGGDSCRVVYVIFSMPASCVFEETRSAA